ncbi:hypothetical protein ACA30_05520 [Virgibacillus soli]|uniref:Diacylglycerol kinase n=1 Tax=Lederbergia galactosidilytica TaxID=217031 RepID=A0A0Q9YCX8_9BACI|nr:diacylglycerol kinase family protein [Lederbergia galactosidilytica]KRG14974.1 hypothetical protein ACA29_05555 [Lederbergia galactosidilytica]KRG15554.1 hypothetical protein ACA30_05520 [Virgibacillus soli]OAK74712.1 hypothetical protein ABB05_03870 [Lederbergia galactosidilytica]
MKYWQVLVLKDRGPFSVIRLFSAFKYAVQGIQYAAKSEKNFQIHLFAASIVIILSFFLKLDKVEWIFIIISIFGVMALELVNSAMERAVDLATDKIHPLAKQAKDLAAAGVLVYTLMAVLIGILILGPKIIQLFY